MGWLLNPAGQLVEVPDFMVPDALNQGFTYRPGHSPQEVAAEEGRQAEYSTVKPTVIREIRKYLTAFNLPADDAAIESLYNSIRPSLEIKSIASIAQDVKDQTDFISAAVSGYANKNTQEDFDKKLNPNITQNHYDTINGIFKDVLGRDATKREADSFAKDLARGDTDAYEIEQFIRTTHPEFKKKEADAEALKFKDEAAAARGALDTSLLAQEDEAFKRATPQIISQFMKAGRLGSSGLDSAIAKERAKLQSERQSRLASIAYDDSVRQQGYGREDFVNNQSQAFGEYLRRSQPSMDRQNTLRGYYDQSPFQALQIGQGYASQRISRGREIDDYAQQQNDFFRALSEQRKQSREAALYGLGGAALGGLAQGAAMKFSDARLKKDIKPIPNALEKLLSLSGVNFKWNGKEDMEMGLLAQEVERVAPEVVYENKDGIKMVDYQSLMGLVVEAVKELSRKVQPHGA